MNLENGRLRPMRHDDLALVLEWRNSDRVRSCMYSQTLITPEAHAAWWERAQANPTSEHLVFEANEKPLGVVNLTDIDRANGRCDWGFYIGAPDAPSGSGTLMGVLALDRVFATLGLRKVSAEVLDFNAPSLRYHLKLGFVEEGRRLRHFRQGERFVDVILLALFEEDWARARQALRLPFAPHGAPTS